MGNEQDALARNFEVFINDFLTKGIDFKMAITTTDTATDYKEGLSKASLNNFLTSDAATTNENEFIQNFKDSIKVGTQGSGKERGIMASLAFMDRYAAENYFREDESF